MYRHYPEVICGTGRTWMADSRDRNWRDCPPNRESDPLADRSQLEFLAAICTEYEAELGSLLREEAETTARAGRERKQLELLATISTRHEQELYALRRAEAQAQQEHELSEFGHAIATPTYEDGWNAALHPRTGTPPNAGWWAKTGGGASGADRPTSFLDAVVQRNATVGELTGIATPEMMRSSRLAVELQSAMRLPGDVARAAAAGLGTGAKAVTNGFATAVKNVVTLGLSSSQLELIGVTKEDRDRGYDTAVAITTASGQVLLAVGTGGVATALSKGGLVARAASGALLVFDAAGNAVGVVQGIYDAAQNGITLNNGARVAAGLLGLGANVAAVKGMRSPEAAKTNVAPKVPRNLKEVDLAARIRAASGSTLKDAGKFFGWEPKRVTKGSAAFTKAMLLSRGWTKERLLAVAEGYEHVARIMPDNPSAAGRAKQLREISARFFGE